jgi:hypothetical protein
MPPRRRAGDDPDDPLDDDFDTVRVRPSYDDELFDEPIYTPGRGHVPTVIDAPFVETADPPPLLTPPPPIAPTTPYAPPTTTPYVPTRRSARKGNDWTALVIALVVCTVIMAACCLAGLALFSTTNPGS